MINDKNNAPHVDSGLRKILENPGFYNLFQSIIGANKHRIKHFDEHFSFSKGMSVLDIGCGTAILSKYLTSEIEYYGCDMENKYIKYASQNAKSNQYFFRERVGNTIRHDWYNKFDYINAHGLLHHLSDIDCDKLLSISYKYLKPGGSLITVDTVKHIDQSKLESWIVSKDRGQNVKTPDCYLTQARKTFKNVEGAIDNQYSSIIPFSVFIMKMKK